MNSNTKEPETTKQLMRAEDGLSLGGITSAKRKRASLPWPVLRVVTLFSVLYFLVQPFKPSAVWSGTSQTGSVVDGVRKQTVEKPTITTHLNGNGRTSDVLWDKYSLVLKGQRIFIQYVHS